uniref:ABC transporter permease n=1 Tax=Roseivirga sp. TaxID=1964215 RepID=UPI004047C12F
MFLIKSVKGQLSYKFLNVFGLTLGLTCGIILFLIVHHEKSFDTYHKNFDRIYRIVQTGVIESQTVYQVGLPKPMPYAFKDKVSGVETIAHFFHARYGQMTAKRTDGTDLTFFENPGVVYAGPELFDVFDWVWLQGDPKAALDEPNTIVIDEEKAKKYFGDENALGKTIHLQGKGDLLVTGVVKKRPNNSDFPFEFFISMKTISDEDQFNSWNSTNSNDRAYVVLNNNTSTSRVEEQMNQIITEQYKTERLLKIELQALSEVHFDEHYGNLNFRVATESYVLTLSIVSVFIVLIACFNFINMSTAVAMRSAREVSIRKILGSSRNALIARYMANTFKLVLASMLISLGLVELLMPTVVQDFTGIVIDYSFINNIDILAYLVALLIVVSFIAGYYPAYLISRFKTVDALNNNFTSGKKGMLLRRILVIVQFAFALIFLFGTLVVLQQSKYAREATLGEMEDWVVFLPLPKSDETTRNTWRGELNKLSEINQYSFSDNTPFSGSSSSTDVNYERGGEALRFTAQMKQADVAYFETYGLQLIVGEYFKELEAIEGFVVNEEFVKKMALQSPDEAIGQVVSYNGITAPIKGVVKDFHTTTAKRQIPPMILFADQSGFRTLGIKMNPKAADDVLLDLEKTWVSLYPDKEFEYSFYDEYIARYYKNEKTTSQMLLIFASIAMAITCLGLYGIVAFMANSRGKEIGIRRVLGASALHIVRIFSSEFMKLVILAFILASPLAYWLMDGWLDDYIYRIEIGPSIFIISLLALFVIALLTTMSKSLKSASSNLVNLLRDE